MSHRGFLVLGSSAIVLASYIVSGSPMLLDLGLLLALLPLTSALVMRFTALWLKGFVDAPVEAVEGSTVRVRVGVVFLQGYRMPAAVLGDGCSVEDGAAVCSYRVRVGVNRFSPPRIAVYDPLGLSYVVYEAEPVTVYGLPRPARVGLAEKLAGIALGFRGERPSPAGDTFIATREAEGVEPPTRIDWRASARRGLLVAKVMGEPGAYTVTIVVAASPDSIEGGVGETLFEKQARIVAGVVEELCRLNLNPLLVVFTGGDRVVEAKGCGVEASRAISRFEWRPASIDALTRLLAGFKTSRPVVVVTGYDYAERLRMLGVEVVVEPNDVVEVFKRVIGGGFGGREAG